MAEYTGRAAIVTGGGPSIGAAVVRRLVGAGAQVRVADLDVDAAQADKPLLVTPRAARIAWRIGRLAPTFVPRSGTGPVEQQRRLQEVAR